MIPIGEQARGRWRAVLPALGVDAKYLVNRHGPCPICRGGIDRFRFDDRDGRGTWYCGHCGAGDGIRLVELILGCDFKEAKQRVEALIGTSPVETSHPERSAEDRSRAMNAIWRQGKALDGDSPAFRYLVARTGLTAFCGDLRSVASIPHYGQTRTNHPALVALVRDKSGKPVNLHRTYLTVGSTKAAISDPKKLMEGTLPGGSAIRLCAPAEIMGIAEGIETALSAMVLFGIGTWSAINDGRLTAWVPPPECKSVVIFGDCDASYAGQAAAYALAKRLRTEKYEVDVRFPPNVGTDWNDVLVQKQSQAA